MAAVLVVGRCVGPGTPSGPAEASLLVPRRFQGLGLGLGNPSPKMWKATVTECMSGFLAAFSRISIVLVKLRCSSPVSAVPFLRSGGFG